MCLVKCTPHEYRKQCSAFECETLERSSICVWFCDCAVIGTYLLRLYTVIGFHTFAAYELRFRTYWMRGRKWKFPHERIISIFIVQSEVRRTFSQYSLHSLNSPQYQPQPESNCGPQFTQSNRIVRMCIMCPMCSADDARASLTEPIHWNHHTNCAIAIANSLALGFHAHRRTTHIKLCTCVRFTSVEHHTQIIACTHFALTSSDVRTPKERQSSAVCRASSA